MFRFSGDERSFRLLLDDVTLLEHTAQQPFAVMIRVEKSYRAKRGTMKTTETEVQRVKLTKVLQLNDDTICFDQRYGSKEPRERICRKQSPRDTCTAGVCVCSGGRRV